MNLFPLLAVALIVWAGIFFFVLGLERKVVALEKRAERLALENR